MGLTNRSNKVCPVCGIGGYVWYMDNSMFIAKCTNCGHYFHKNDFSMCVLDIDAKTHVTNADRIRAMNAEQLENLIQGIYYDDLDNTIRIMDETVPFPDILDWLKQETDGYV